MTNQHAPESNKPLFQLTDEELMSSIRTEIEGMRNHLLDDLKILLREIPRQESTDEDEYYTVRDLEKLLKHSNPTILALFAEDDFPGVKPAGKWRVKKSDFDEWWKCKLLEKKRLP